MYPAKCEIFLIFSNLLRSILSRFGTCEVAHIQSLIYYSSGQNILEEFLKLGEIDFSMKCFRAVPLQLLVHLVQLSKFTFWLASWTPVFNFRQFRGFLEISRQHVIQFVHLLCSDTNVVLLHLW